MEANAGKSFQMQYFFNIFPRISLHCKLVPVQYWEYEYGLLAFNASYLANLAWPEFVCFPVGMCHRGPLLSATPGFLLWQKLCVKARVALGKLLGKFVYFAVKICHQFTLPSATPSFPFRKILENPQKHQRQRSAWVGQADFGKLELNCRNHGGNCQRLSMKHD